MTFIILLCGFLCERFFDFSHLRRWNWLTFLQMWLHQRLIKISPYLVLTINMLLPLLLVGWINHLLTGVFYNVFKIIFGLVILIYCFGPENFWVWAFKNISSAKDLINNPYEKNQNETGSFFVESHDRVFAVMFWFLLLGPVGAVIYRISNVSKVISLDPKESFILHEVHALLDWLPIRIYTFTFAIGGHFAKVLSQWQKYSLTALRNNQILLRECGLAALDLPLTDASQSENVKRETLILLDRVYVIVFFLLALGVII